MKLCLNYVLDFSYLIIALFPLVEGRSNSDFAEVIRRKNGESDLVYKFYNSMQGKAEEPFPDLAQKVRLFLGNYDNGKNPKVIEGVSESCAAHINGWSNNLTADWSLQMFDSMSKIPEGLLTGNIYSTGAYDECLQVHAEVAMSETNVASTFQGKYCTGFLLPGSMCYGEGNQKGQVLSRNEYGLKQFQHTRAASLEAIGLYPSLATCFPSSCSTDDINTILFTVLEPTGLCMAVDTCQTDETPKLRPADIVMILILSTMALFCVVGTAIDLLLTYNNGGHQRKVSDHSTIVQSVVAFSLYTNIKKWSNTNGGGDNLGCIHGIRFLSTCWVVLAHTWSTWFPIRNYVDILMIYKDNWTIYPIINGTVSVDTFFTLSAILVAYNVLKMLDKSKGRFNVPMFYLHRYLRLTPTYALLIGIMATWFEYLRPGPFTISGLGPAAASCRKNWWHNLLYINNLVKYPDDPSSGMCHGESWYLGNDMQFFLISPLLLFPLWKWKSVGMTIMGVFTVASVAVPFIVTYIEKLDGTMLPFSINIEQTMDKMYVKPWMRFGPYIVGLWAGYLLYKVRTRRTPFKLSKWIVVAGWLISTATALAIIFGFIPYFDPTTKYNRIDHAFYGGFHRFAWGGVISWVVLTCTMGFGGLINKFLSWKAFIPLGRLTFCTYLISFWLQNLFMLSSRQPIHYDLYTGINLFFAHMVMSLLVGFVATITLESPFIALEKLIFPRESLPANKIPKESIENSTSSSNNNSQANLANP